MLSLACNLIFGRPGGPDFNCRWADDGRFVPDHQVEAFQRFDAVLLKLEAALKT